MPELHNFECRPCRVTYIQAAEGVSRRRLRYEIFKVDVARYGALQTTALIATKNTPPQITATGCQYEYSSGEILL